jgi:hypothetical protein
MTASGDSERALIEAKRYALWDEPAARLLLPTCERDVTAVSFEASGVAAGLKRQERYPQPTTPIRFPVFQSSGVLKVVYHGCADAHELVRQESHQTGKDQGRQHLDQREPAPSGGSIHGMPGSGR